MLHTRFQWEYLPRELRFGSGITYWCRLRDEAGVRQRLHEVLPAELNAASRLNRYRCLVAGRPGPARLETPRNPQPFDQTGSPAS